ncbi:MAG TPA: ABC transporter permease [Candidatus Acidoferrales bacterium]|jgi:predicted permease|nr:ABC transporter permease [Candidatus Acidoferrales bacterium]
MESLLQDVKYAVRTLAKNRSFTIVAVLTLALGIGANTALFSVANGVLLNPLPFPAPNQLVALYAKRVGFERASISYPNFLDWQRDNRSFASMAAFRQDDFNLTGAGEAEHIRGEMVSADFFATLGVRLAQGRCFTADEDRVGGAPVVLISAGLWTRKFGTSASVLGQRIALNGTDYTIIGVLPASFRLRLAGFAEDSDAYVPIGQWTDVIFHDRSAGLGMKAIGRLKPGVAMDQARGEMNSIAKRLGEAYPVADKDSGITVVSLKQSMVAEIEPFLFVLLGAVGFVLLIACVNVANLVLARSTGRAREFAIRSALGASRARVLRQLLTESTLVALAGGALGLLVAAWGTQGILTLVSDSLPRAQEVRVDGRVLFFTLGISLLSGILFGLAPALRVARVDVQTTLKEGGRGASGSRHRAQGIFVVAEMAMALVLLVGAGLMLRSLARLWSTNPGFDPHHVLMFYVALPPAIDTATPASIRASLLQLHDKLASIPGVQSVSLLRGSLPMWDDSEDPFWIAGRPKPLSDNDKNWSIWTEVEPDYLKVMGIPLVRGRFFTANDTENSPRVAVIDEDFARKFFPGEDPIGKTFVDDYVGSATTIVGVVGHVKQWGLDDKLAIRAEFYLPFRQIPDQYMSRASRNTTLVLRTTFAPLSLTDDIRREIQQMNSEEVMFGPKSMDDIVYNRSILAQRFSMILLGAFAAVALLLASVGIYGVVSYIVVQRTHEIGIRVALGAQRSDVLLWVLGAGARMALIGLGIGIAVALALTRLMANLLYGVSTTDPATFLGVAFLLIFVALAACYIPARRAMRMDPMVALRDE